MSEHPSEQSGADFSVARDLPPLEILLGVKDLKHFFRLGRQVVQKLSNENVSIRNLGTWQIAAGYLEKIFGGLGQDSLRGFSFVDVGGGAYGGEGSSYGPDLAKALNHFGADVTIVDPVASKGDFLPEELHHIIVAPETIENFVQRKQSSAKEVSMLVSASFFGSPSKVINSQEECLATITTLRDMAKVSDVQLHVVNNLDRVNWQLLANQFSDPSIGNGLQVKYLGDVTLSAEIPKDQKPTFDLIIVDNRLPR